jgi:hypothetical protein
MRGKIGNPGVAKATRTPPTELDGGRTLAVLVQCLLTGNTIGISAIDAREKQEKFQEGVRGNGRRTEPV